MSLEIHAHRIHNEVASLVWSTILRNEWKKTDKKTLDQQVDHTAKLLPANLTNNEKILVDCMRRGQIERKVRMISQCRSEGCMLG